MRPRSSVGTTRPSTRGSCRVVSKTPPAAPSSSKGPADGPTTGGEEREPPPSFLSGKGPSRSGAEGPQADQRDCADHDAVPGEHAKAVLADKPDQPAHHEQGRD